MRLYIKNIPSDVFIQPNWLSDGRLYLDLDAEFNIVFNKEVQQLNDINKITLDTAISSSIPATNKNLSVLRPSMNVEDSSDSYPSIDIDIDFGDHVPKQNKLVIKSYNAESNRIEIDLEIKNHWILELQKLFLNDLDFGEFTYTFSNLYNNWLNKPQYADGDQGIYMGHCYYGAYVLGDVLSESDFRPLVHAKAIFDKAFKTIGVPYSFPLLETTSGRRLVTYINSDDFNKDEALLKQSRYQAKFTKDKVLNIGTGYTETKMIPDSENYDNGNNYNLATGEFSRSGNYEFHANFNFNFICDKQDVFDQSPCRLAFELVKIKKDGTEELLGGDEINYVSIKEINKSIHVQVDAYLVPGEKVYWRTSTHGSVIISAVILAKTRFWNEPLNSLIQPGDTIKISNNLKKDPVIDYIKGIIHMFNIKIYEDYSTGTIYFLTPYEVDFYGTTIEGFYKNVATNIKLSQLQKSEVYTQLEEIAKNKIYEFKKSTDAYIQSLNLKDYETTFSRFIDNGFNKDNETDHLENPYFEPSISRDTGLDGAGGILEAPWLVDNLDGNISYKIAPRIFFAEGWTRLYYPIYGSGGKGFNPIQIIFGEARNIKLLNIPLVYQKQNQAIGLTGVYPNQVEVLPSKQLIYGTNDNDLYEKYYRQYNKSFENRPSYKLIKIVENDEYFQEDFRNRIIFDSSNLNTGELIGRLVKISNFDPVKRTADYLIIPDNQADEDNVFITPLVCDNYPEIVVTKVGTTYNFSIGGTYSSGISEVKFYYKFVKTGLGFIETTSLVNPLEDFNLKMIVKWDTDCPDSIREVVIHPFSKNPKLNVAVDPLYVTITDTGVYDTGIFQIKIDWSLDNKTWYPYSEPLKRDLLSGDIIYARETVTYTNGSTPSVVESTGFSLKPSCPKSDDVNAPGVMYVKTAQGYTLHKTGIVAFECLDQIQVRQKNKEEEWRVYNERTEILSKQYCWEFRRYISYCGIDVCPDYCSPIFSTDCGTCSDTLLKPTETVSSELCTHLQKYEHPDTASNNWKATLINDDIYIIPEIKTYVKKDCGGVITNEHIKTIIYDRWNFKTLYSYTWNIDWTIDTIKVHVANSGGIGAQHTINVGVKYLSGMANDELIVLIESAIKSGLADIGFRDNENYILLVSVTGSTTKTLEIATVAKHNPVNDWIGIYAGTDDMIVLNTLNIAFSQSSSKKEFQLIPNSQPIVENVTPYGTLFRLKFRTNSLDLFLNDSSSNFNLLALNSIIPIIADILTTDNDSGKKFTASATLPGCSGVPTWLWKYGGIAVSTTDTAMVYTNQNSILKIIAHCPDSGFCNYIKEINLVP